MSSKYHRKISVVCCWCNQPSSIVWIHGRGQFSVCGINVDECCRGENIEMKTDENKSNRYENK